MRVSLSTYGGLLPRFGGTPHIVDSDELAEQDKEELLRLVSAAIATTSAVSPPTGADQLRDARTYQITIENSCTTGVLEAIDGSVPEAFAALRNWLRDH